MSARERFLTHMRQSTLKIRKYKLYYAINKYGRDNFYFEVIEDRVPLSIIDAREIYWIKKYNSYYKGYNSTKGGDGRIINKLEDEEKIISLVQDGVATTEIAKIYNVDKTTIRRLLWNKGISLYNKIDNEEFVKLYPRMKNKEIALYFGVNEVTITRKKDELNIRKNKKTIQKWVNFNVNGFKSDFENGIDRTSICTKYNISNSTMYRLAKKYNLKCNKRINKKNRRSYANNSDFNITNFIEDYNNNMGTMDICNKYGISLATFNRICRKHNLQKHP